MLRFKKVWVVSIAMFAATGINVATADAPTITGFPHQIAQVDLAGYKLVTSYPLGANAGFSFEQNYLPGGKVTAHEREQGANEWRARQIAVADGVPGASCRNAEIDTVDLDHARRGDDAIEQRHAILPRSEHQARKRCDRWIEALSSLRRPDLDAPLARSTALAKRLGDADASRLRTGT